MIIATVIINALAMLSCGIAAGMNFGSGFKYTGVAMTLLFLMNMTFFIVNLGRL